MDTYINVVGPLTKDRRPNGDNINNNPRPTLKSNFCSFLRLAQGVFLSAAFPIPPPVVLADPIFIHRHQRLTENTK